MTDVLPMPPAPHAPQQDVMPTPPTHYEIQLDSYSFFGPDGPARILVEGVAIVHGPDRPNWQPADYLVRVLHPFEVGGEQVTHLLLCPRYDTDTVDDVMGAGCKVGVALVNAGCTITPDVRYSSRDLTYWNLGTVGPHSADAQPTASNSGTQTVLARSA